MIPSATANMSQPAPSTIPSSSTRIGYTCASAMCKPSQNASAMRQVCPARECHRRHDRRRQGERHGGHECHQRTTADRTTDVTPLVSSDRRRRANARQKWSSPAVVPTEVQALNRPAVHEIYALRSSGRQGVPSPVSRPACSAAARGTGSDGIGVAYGPR
jgi:hypothetical protein